MSNEVISLRRPDGSFISLAEIEAAVFDHALRVHHTVSAAAKAIGVGRSTLYRRVDDIKTRDKTPRLPNMQPGTAVVKKTATIPVDRFQLRKAVGCDLRWEPDLLL